MVTGITSRTHAEKAHRCLGSVITNLISPVRTQPIMPDIYTEHEKWQCWRERLSSTESLYQST